MRPKVDCVDRLVHEAMRRIQLAVPGSDPFLPAVQRMLETELDKAPIPLCRLVKLGRRRALDRVLAQARRTRTAPSQ